MATTFVQFAPVIAEIQKQAQPQIKEDSKVSQ